MDESNYRKPACIFKKVGKNTNEWLSLHLRQKVRSSSGCSLLNCSQEEFVPNPEEHHVCKAVVNILQKRFCVGHPLESLIILQDPHVDTDIDQSMWAFIRRLERRQVHRKMSSFLLNLKQCTSSCRCRRLAALKQLLLSDVYRVAQRLGGSAVASQQHAVSEWALSGAFFFFSPYTLSFDNRKVYMSEILLFLFCCLRVEFNSLMQLWLWGQRLVVGSGYLNQFINLFYNPYIWIYC